MTSWRVGTRTLTIAYRSLPYSFSSSCSSSSCSRYASLSSSSSYSASLLPRLRAFSSYGLRLAAWQQPHPDKVHNGGEDALHIDVPDARFQLSHVLTVSNAKATAFATASSSSSSSLSNVEFHPTAFSSFAVYDGVGSWSFEKNVDVRQFSVAMSRATDGIIKEARSSMSSSPASSLASSPASSSSATASSAFPPLSQQLLPKVLLSRVWDTVKQQQLVGSCTACIVTLERSLNGSLQSPVLMRACSVGDSGFLVLRARNVNVVASSSSSSASSSSSSLPSDSLLPVSAQTEQSRYEVLPVSIPTADVDVSSLLASDASYFLPALATSTSSSASSASRFFVAMRSLQQQHYFNCPLQLGLTSQRENAFDSVEDAIEMQFMLQANDVLLLSTDGLFDNLFEQDILNATDRCVASSVNASSSSSSYATSSSSQMHDSTSNASIVNVRALVQDLCALSCERSWDRTKETPFSLHAKASNVMWNGGRRDDVTVIAIQIV